MRDVDTLKGLHGVKTLGSAKKRYISRVQSSTYLDLYMMEKEAERLEKESLRLEMRHQQIAARLKEIADYRETANKGRSTTKKADKAEPEEAAAPKTWKKVSLRY
ncbi:MAG: ankyrin [bacterium]|nr:ankyrin [bacterium]